MIGSVNTYERDRKEMNIKECCEEMGTDYQNLRYRFGTDERIARFMRLFLRDESYAQLKKALEEKDYTLAFRAAHTLKGVCLNVGLDRLQKSASELTEAVRGGIPKPNTGELMQTVTADYELTIRTIEKYMTEGQK